MDCNEAREFDELLARAHAAENERDEALALLKKLVRLQDEPIDEWDDDAVIANNEGFEAAWNEIRHFVTMYDQTKCA